MNRYVCGLIAGFCATIVLSIFMVLKAMLGLLPSFDAIAMLANVTHTGLAGGWIAHFVIGTVLWGLIFAALYPSLPGGAATGKGVVFGVLGWLAMMIVFMPLAGAGFFAAWLGLPVTVATLVLHLIYGAVLGAVYGRIPHSAKSEQATA